LEFGAGSVCCEHPFDAGSGFIPPLLPCCDLVSEPVGIVDAASDEAVSFEGDDHLVDPKAD
jgi:hypothetical protein